jgi:hypothetical protein
MDNQSGNKIRNGRFPVNTAMSYAVIKVIQHHNALLTPA